MKRRFSQNRLASKERNLYPLRHRLPKHGRNRSGQEMRLKIRCPRYLSTPCESLPRGEVTGAVEASRQLHEGLFLGTRLSHRTFQLFTHNSTGGNAATLRCLLQPLCNRICNTDCQCTTHAPSV